MRGWQRAVRQGQAQTRFEEAERGYLDVYDVQVTSRIVRLADRSLRLRVFESGEGSPVVLLHTGGGFALQWLPLFPYLQDFHLIAPDMPGRGLSDRFDYRRIDLRTHAVQIIEALLAALELGSVVIIGASLGAYRALAFAHDAPDRVRALCLFGSPALVLDNRDCASQLKLLAVPGLGPLLLRLSTEKQARSGLGVFAGRHAVEQLPDAFFAYSYREGRLPGSARTFASECRWALTPRGWRHARSLTTDELADIKAPTLLLWGRRDVFGSPELAERVNAHIPDARLELVDSGHLPWYDDAPGSAQLVRQFLG